MLSSKFLFSLWSKPYHFPITLLGTGLIFIIIILLVWLTLTTENKIHRLHTLEATALSLESTLANEYAQSFLMENKKNIENNNLLILSKNLSYKIEQLQRDLLPFQNDVWYVGEPFGYPLLAKLKKLQQQFQHAKSATPDEREKYLYQVNSIIGLMHRLETQLAQDTVAAMGHYWKMLWSWGGLGLGLTFFMGYRFYHHDQLRTQLVAQLAQANDEKAHEIKDKERLQQKQIYLNKMLSATRRINQLITHTMTRGQLIRDACQILVKQMNYSSAWIVIFDEYGRCIDFEEMGFADQSPAFRRFLQRGNCSPCLKVMQHHHIKLYDEPLSVCVECPLGFTYHGNSILLAKLCVEERMLGAIGVTITPDNLNIDPDENISLFNELAADIRFALQKIELQERHVATEFAIRQREEQFRNLAANVPGVIYQLRQYKSSAKASSEGCYQFTYLSPQLNQMYGISPEEVALNPALMVHKILPEDRTNYLSNFENYQDAQPWQQEWRILGPDGEIHYIRGYARPRITDDNAVWWDGLLLDITEQKKAEQRIREEQLRFRGLFNNLINGVSIFKTVKKENKAEETFLLLDINQAGLNIIGKRWSEVVGRSVTDTFPQAIEQGLFAVMRQVWVTGQPRFYPSTEYNGTHAGIWLDNAVYKLCNNELVVVFEDVTQRRQAELALQENEAHFRALFDSAPVALWEEDFSAVRQLLFSAWPNYPVEDWNDYLATQPQLVEQCIQAVQVLRCNRRAVQLFDADSEEALLPSLQNIFTAESVTVFRRELAAFLRGETQFEHESAQRTLSGKIIWTEVRVTLAPGHETDWAKVFVAISDLSERKANESALLEAREKLEENVQIRTHELQLANEQLQRLSQMKDEFLASMSHELRSPLNAVLAGSEVILEGSLGPITQRQQKALRRICDSGYHLLSLINDILDVAKLEAGKMTLELEPSSPQDIAQSCLTLIRESALKKKLTIHTHFDPTVTKIAVDQRRLKQILINLLSNAIKFTSVGGKIGLTYEGWAESRQVRFTVWDNGIGIEPMLREKLFQAFVQLDSRLARKYEGTGLGLALVKELAELHGGSVALDSTPGQGSQFHVNLPWEPTVLPQSKPALVATCPADRQENVIGLSLNISVGKKILLVDDSATARQLLATYLRYLGYEVQCATNGESALQMLAKNFPDAILLDVQMPDIDGLEVTQQIRANPQWAALPVIALTALAMPGDEARCLQAGMNAYLSKPAPIHQVVRTLEKFFSPPTAGHHVANPTHES